MAWGICRGGGVILLIAILPSAACSQRSTRPIAAEVCADRSLLFGNPQETLFATQIARSDWPAAPHGYHAPQETYFIEYYRDYFGNAFQERNAPQRNFYSYKIGGNVTSTPP